MAANLNELKQVPQIIETQRRMGKIDEPIISFFYGSCKLRHAWVYKVTLSIYLLVLCWCYAYGFAWLFSNIITW